MRGACRLWWVTLLALAGCSGPAADVRVGSKKFTESEVLGEMLTQVAETANVRATSHLRRARRHHRRLARPCSTAQSTPTSNTIGNADGKDILANAGAAFPTRRRLRASLKKLGLGMSKSLGFNDSYAIGIARRTGQTNSGIYLDIRSAETPRPAARFQQPVPRAQARRLGATCEQRYGLARQRTPAGAPSDDAFSTTRRSGTRATSTSPRSTRPTPS